MSKAENLKIVEGIAGTWFYHLSETGKNGQPALCGNTRVMTTEAPLSTWGIKGNVPSKYCKECEEIWNASQSKGTA